MTSEDALPVDDDLEIPADATLPEPPDEETLLLDGGLPFSGLAQEQATSVPASLQSEPEATPTEDPSTWWG